MSSISNTITSGIELATTSSPGTYASPLTITSTGYVNAGTSGFGSGAVYASGAAVLTLVNQGRIRAAGTVIGVLEGAANGLTLNNTGTITAAAGVGVSLAHSG